MSWMSFKALLSAFFCLSILYFLFMTESFNKSLSIISHFPSSCCLLDILSFMASSLQTLETIVWENPVDLQLLKSMSTSLNAPSFFHVIGWLDIQYIRGIIGSSSKTPYKALELLHVVSIRNSCWNISESKISFSQEVKSVTFLWGCLLSANSTSLSKCLEEKNMARISAGHLVLCCGRCWQERCRTRMWTPPLSSGEWATTVCSCPCPTAVQRASNCCWGNAGEQTWRETKLEGRKKIK